MDRLPKTSFLNPSPPSLRGAAGDAATQKGLGVALKPSGLPRFARNDGRDLVLRKSCILVLAYNGPFHAETIALISVKANPSTLDGKDIDEAWEGVWTFAKGPEKKISN